MTTEEAQKILDKFAEDINTGAWFLLSEEEIKQIEEAMAIFDEKLY
jgi:hypothetical protein